MSPAPFALYLITDAGAGERLPELTERALCGAADGAQPGRIAVQLRLKDWPAQARREAGEALRRITASHGVKLLVNGEPALAAAIGADGVHCPAQGPAPDEARRQLSALGLGRKALVGASCHDADALRRAAAAGADFATLSPFFTVPNKGAPLDEATATAWLRERPLPTLALGGLDADGARRTVAAGADGVAVIRAVYADADPAAAVRSLLAAVDRGRAAQAGHHASSEEGAG